MTDRPSDDDPLSFFYHALRAPRRRQVITILREANESSVSVRHLARVITAKEEGISKEHATGDQYRNVYNSLSQTHLPTLDELAIIAYDGDRQTVETGSKFTIATLLLVLTQSTSEILEQEFDEGLDNE